MSTRKTTVFTAVLIAVTFLVIGMVLASRLDLSSNSTAQTINVPPMNSAPITGPVDAQTFRNIAKTATPWVVNIRTESRQRTQDLTEFFGGQDDLFNRFFGQPGGRQRPRDQIAVAAGTGFIIDKAGFILTNNHVVEGATKIKVSLFGDEEDVDYEARVIGRDQLTDSALIELTEKPGRALPEAKFGDSSTVEPGDWVMAIGNPFNLAHTVSVGVISALERPFPITDGRSANVLQTDAAINPGNSGGPLLNLRGEVVGINTAIYSNERAAGNIGIGFAIPINQVRALLPQLRTGKVTRGVIGVSIAPVSRADLEEFGLKERRGALVAAVERNSPADQGGIEPGDVILEFNGKPIRNREALVQLVVETKPGTVVPVKVLRARKEQTINVTVGELNLESERARTRGGDPDTPDPGDQATADSFGIGMANVTPEIARRLKAPSGTSGVLITEVEPGSPAGRAGLQPRDIILQINRQDVSSASEASRALQQVPAGRSASFLVWRINPAGVGQELFVMVRKD
jgi:serine protease Do